MTSKQLEPEKAKKAYVKPQFTQIALRPEEAVLGHCKSSHSGGPNASAVCHPTLCRAQGS